MSSYDNHSKPTQKLFFDIETLPANEAKRQSAIDLTIKKLSHRDKKLKITKSTKEKVYLESAISGDFGQIFCIGYATNSDEVKIISDSEYEILTAWWKVAEGADLFIGHNIMDFDLRFIFKRSIVNSIKPCAKHLNLSFARYRNYPIFDTMREWEKWSLSYISLDALSKILDLPTSKDNIDGSQVYDYYKKGKHNEIYEYCKKDVILTRQVYNKMIFSAG